jgi:6-pyruvoyltetrahydropterin/6-carboxytetrahydropterin synthase
MPPIIRVTKEFPFEMSHALWNHDGPCRNIHGHSYRLFVTLSGIPADEPGNPKDGMVIDFSELKSIIRKTIVNIFDHALVLPRTLGKEKTEALKNMFGNTVIVDYQPTCENLVSDFAARISKHLPPEVSLFSLRLHETATSFAEWFASDNK